MDCETPMAGERTAADLSSALHMCGNTERAKEMEGLANKLRRRAILASGEDESLVPAVNSLYESVWEQLIATKPPPMLTAYRIKRVKPIIWRDTHFWWDMLDRHGLRETALVDLPDTEREHAIGNFWGVMCETWMGAKGK